MGTNHSQLKGLEIEEKSVEVSDFWSLHTAQITNEAHASNLSIFIGDTCIEGPLWNITSPLEKSLENLKKYRHPCIVKYISSWQKSGKVHLAVENIVPLSSLLVQQSDLQICIGLHSVLKALCFLHEKAQVSHNNVCIASMYVGNDGCWKLGSMEFSMGFKQLTGDFLKKSRHHRYEKAADPNEDKYFAENAPREFIDCYGFCVMVCEILKGKTDEDIPNLEDFREICKNSLQEVVIASRPNLSTLLNHEFFCHDFVTIHSFLKELPLKTDIEKSDFFQGLVERLRNFNESTVAKQLGSLLLSRMVLLNKTAQEQVLPSILSISDDSKSLFTPETFVEFITPKLLEIFRVRDSQIRLLILDYFKQFAQTFTKDELQLYILPELLLGVKDVNEELVCVTLRTLADLVPILGAETVIGGNRARIFNDGRPIVHETQTIETILEQPLVDLPERPQPDGEEFENSVEVQSTPEETPQIEDLDNWEDWEESAAIETDGLIVETIERKQVNVKKMVDITELDIKTRTADDDCIDFFQDMEPVIERASMFIVESDSNGKFAVDGATGEEGWGNEDWD